MTTKALITELKDTEQDFESYPTTNEIISALVQDIERYKKDYYSGCPPRPHNQKQSINN